MAGSEDNLFIWNGGVDVPWSPSSLHGRMVSRVSFGDGHYAVLTEDGHLFMAGKSDRGQLGNGTQNDEETVSEAQLLDLKPHSVLDVSCGHSHTAVVTSEGLVFCWGDNRDHQCGPGDDPFFSTPTQVPFNALDKMCQISCGKSHTVAISESNELWTWGSGFQLGLGISKVASKPRKVEFLCGRRVIGVTCGDDHTAALVARSQESKGKKLDDKSLGFIARKMATNPKRASKLVHQSSGKLVDGDSEEAEKEKKVAAKPSDFPEKCPPAAVRNSLTDASEIKSVVENVARNLKLRMKGDKGDHATNLRLSEVKVAQSDGEKEAETSFTRELESRDPGSAGSPRSPPVSHSPSAFLNEAEAKEFLQKQLYGDLDDPLGVTASKSESATKRVEKKDSVDMTPSSSPFTKTVENLLQHVPSSPVVVQEYVTNLTKAVVSNIRISVMDRFSFSSSQADLSQASCATASLDTTVEDNEVIAPIDMKLFSDSLPAGGASGRMIQKSTSMGLSNILKQTHHRNGSLPTSALQALCQLTVRTGPKLQLDTEVWTWGCGSSGQLGHGDLLDRCHPCAVQSLSQCHVVKVVAGSHHTVALTANSQIYVWGDNTQGQLGHRSTTTSAPISVSVFGNLPAWDVAAGGSQTLVLYDTLMHKPRIYFCGGEPASESNQSSVNQLTAVMKTKDIGLVHSISAGRVLSSCIVCPSSNLQLDGAIYELASNERFFHTILDRIYQIFIKPLQTVNPDLMAGRTELFESLQSLFEAYENVVRLISTNHIELSLVLRGALNLLHVQLLHDTDQCVSVYQKYFRIFNDVLAYGGLEKCVRMNKEFFDKVKPEFSGILEDSKVNLNDLGLSLHHLLYLPFERPRQYQKHLGNIATHYPVYSSEEVRLHKVTTAFDRLRLTSSSEHALAENTAAFWKTVSPKLAESLQTTGRLLVRDSRKNGLALVSAGRFSSHSFFLFSDCFIHLQNSFPTVHRLVTVWIEVLPDSKQLKNAINLVTPEEVLTLTAPTHSDKAEWVWAFNQTITQALIDEKNLDISVSVAMVPPRDRHAGFAFTKPGHLKDSRYTGMWRSGKIHGYGELIWPDGRRYIGQFHNGQFEGCGVYTVPKDDGTSEASEGWWKAGQLHGYGVIRYSNGDVYKGHFSEGKRHGHGCMKQGKFTAATASLFNGQWKNDKRSGYGVCHDITKGNKYMGMWLDDNRHGSGIIVTLDGLYFEGNFSYGKMTGTGLLVTDDGCWYEGEFFGGTSLCGKGTLTMPNGDYIEGQFNGSLTEGVKVNGTFYKNCDPPSDTKKPLAQENVNPKSFGKLCIPASAKWDEIFAHCYSVLGCAEGQTPDSERAWTRMASIISSCSGTPLTNSRSKIKMNVDDLERIPSPSIHGSELTFESYRSVKSYLSKAFDAVVHPLGQLMGSLVDVYLATYVGVGAHMRLLFHAVQELKAYVDKIYPIVRLLFPLLPLTDGPVQLSAKSMFNGTDDLMNGNDPGHMTDSFDLSSNEVEIVTADSLLFPFLLPKIYPPLFSLYALYNEKEDDRYWKRVRLWNKQSNLALMAYLGVDRKFWLSNEETMQEFASNILSGVQEDSYIDAIDRLQRISTSFTPTEKLSQIQLTFGDITRVVQHHIGRCYQWSMDELFPVFHYVVVRARIQHLGAEIHFVEDLIERHLENGQLGIMFTTLKACYYQILNEKVI